MLGMCVVLWGRSAATFRSGTMREGRLGLASCSPLDCRASLSLRVSHGGHRVLILCKAQIRMP